MSEVKADDVVRTMSERCVQTLRAELEVELQEAWLQGKEAGKAEGVSEGEFRGRKQGVIRVAMNLLRMGTEPAVVAKAAELPEPIIRKLAQDNGIVLA